MPLLIPETRRLLCNGRAAVTVRASGCCVIGGNAAPVVPAREGLKSLEAVPAAKEAARTRARVPLQPAAVVPKPVTQGAMS